jgi:hypothetical protein
VISWRAIAFDLKVLSNGVFLYAIFYLMGFVAFFSQLGDSKNIHYPLAVPLLATSLCILTHISNERADRVADQIVIEHGGYRRRILARMISVSIYNSILVTTGLLLVGLTRGRAFELPAFWVPSALASIIVFSTAGVIVAGAFPHPLASVAFSLGLLFAGGTAPTDSFQSSTVIGLISSKSLGEWFGHFWPFAAFWFAIAAALSPFAFGRKRISIPRRKRDARRSQPEVPSWITWHSTFLTKAILSARTNWLPLAGLLVALSSYTFSTFLVASKYAELKIQGDYFAIFTGLILVNVLSAILLAKSVQTKEVDENESFIFASQAQALRAKYVQTAIAVTLNSLALLTVIALITHTPLTSTIFVRGALAICLIAPGITAVGLLIGSRLRSTPIIGLVSFLLTLPEFVVSKYWPQVSPLLPSSLFSQIAGVPGPFLQDPRANLPLWVAVVPCIVGFGLAIYKVFGGKPQARQTRGSTAVARAPLDDA